MTNINILMLGVCYKKYCHSDYVYNAEQKEEILIRQERIELIRQFVSWFGKDCIDCLLADREFVGHIWLDFLTQNNIKYYIG